MRMQGELETLEKAIGYTFVNRPLLQRALTHKSRSHEQHDSGHAAMPDNEQLEFLGDSILGFLTSDYLVRHYPEAGEGRLSKWKAHLVSAAHLHEAAQQIDLGRHLLLGRGEEMSGGRSKRALLADAMEALIAATFIDGGIDAARHLVESVVLCAMEEDHHADDARADHKTELQERAQSLKLPIPRYAIVAESGPEHLKTFTVEVRVGKELVGQAQGSSKKHAGQLAAQRVLQQLAQLGN
jgi:ribonuclease III